MDSTEECLAMMSKFLHMEGMLMIYLRSYFYEFKNDEEIKEVLVNTRSMDQYEKMDACGRS